MNNFLRCTSCGATFDELDGGCCPKCGSEDIVVDDIEDEDDVL